MRRTKNCVFKYRIEACFKWGDGTAVSNYSENREKETAFFQVSFGVKMEQLRAVARNLNTEDMLIGPVGGDETDVSILVRGVIYPAPR